MYILVKFHVSLMSALCVFFLVYEISSFLLPLAIKEKKMNPVSFCHLTKYLFIIWEKWESGLFGAVVSAEVIDFFSWKFRVFLWKQGNSSHVNITWKLDVVVFNVHISGIESHSIENNHFFVYYFLFIMWEVNVEPFWKFVYLNSLCKIFSN